MADRAADLHVPTPMLLAPAPTRPSCPPLETRLAQAAAELWKRSPGFDLDGADPAQLCAPLAEHGLFRDALPVEHGGSGLHAASATLAHTLMVIGGADLSAGRIFEGHVNAVKLVFRYGGGMQARALAQDVQAGAVCGVWNAEAPPGLHLEPAPGGSTSGRLRGSKIYASGLGLVTRPILTARTETGEMLMLAPRLTRPPPHDLSAWTVRGMRATATGTVDFTGSEIGAQDIVGEAGDYYRAPLFKGGAWRFAAVQAGAVLRITQLMREELRRRGREGDPHQKARLGAAALAAETAELWVRQAAALAEEPSSDHDAVEAYVNLARLAVERAALEVISLAERGLGLSALTRPNAVERVVRDLSTYLRQPFPDGALEDAAAYVAKREAPPPWSASRDFAL